MKKERNSEKLRVNSTERKRSEGITLIALIITIIILIILAVVTVQFALNGGITGYAQEASNHYKVEQEKELIGVGYAEYKAAKYLPQTEQIDTTEDYEDLAVYFLGADKQGLTNDEFVKLLSPDTTETTIVFTNGVTMSIYDADQDINLNEVYYYFNYNGFRYKLVLNATTGTTSRIEIVEKIAMLQVNGATVEGYESLGGWDITFTDSKNAYYLTKDGVIQERSNLELIKEDIENNFDEYSKQAEDLGQDTAQNTDIGIGTDGKVVNLDIWDYTVEYDYVKFKETGCIYTKRCL